MKKIIIDNIILFITVSFLAFLALVTVYSLPCSLVKKQIEKSLNVFEREGDYYDVFDGIQGSRLDNYTDAYFLQLCFIKKSEAPVDNALSAYALDYVDYENSPSKSLLAYFNGDKMDVIPRETRFWNGYVIVLKPLLMFFTYSDVRYLNMLLHIALLCIFLALLQEKGMLRYGVAFVLTYISMCPITIMMNIFYSCIFYSTIIPMIIMLRFNDFLLIRKRYISFFILVGMETVYFNMNSSLIMPFGMCVILYYLINGFDFLLVKQIKEFVIFTFSWVMGACGLWAFKWLLALELTNNYSVSDLLGTITMRVSTNYYNRNCTRLEAIKENIKVLLQNRIGIIALAFFCIICVILVLCCRLNGVANLLNKFVILLICAAVPFVWYVLMPNHCMIHKHFTYRTLSIAIFAFTSGMASLIGKFENNIIRNF